MSTGSSSDSAELPSEPEPPFTSDRQHSWLASPGRHPVTWALAGVVLLTSGGVALIQHQPGARAHAQSVYCGLVTCAVLRSVADPSSTVALAPRPSLALPSFEPASRRTAPARASKPARTSTPTHPPAPARSGTPEQVAPSQPTAAPAPAQAPSPTRPPRPTRWPWPPTWGWPSGGWGGGGGGGGGWPGGGGGWGGWPGGGGRHAQPANTSQRGYQPRHAHHL
jgi:hypothetical protein